MASSAARANPGAPSAWDHGRSWRVPVKDLPWRRLPWILPVAVAFWILALWGFGRFIASPAPPPEPPPLDTRIIELPPDPPPMPPVAAPAPPEPTVARPEPVQPKEPAPPKPAPVQPKVAPQPRLVPEPSPAPEAPINPQPAPPPPAPPPAIAPPAPPAPSPTPASANPSQSGSAGANALVQPLPKIPDELIDDAEKYPTSIRLNIAADGSVTAELVNPTPNPRLNRLYLETYKSWRFFPATRDGKPVASTQTLRVTVNGK